MPTALSAAGTGQCTAYSLAILAAAIAASADYLVTGDKSHFAHRYSTRVSGVCVFHPTDFLARQEDRLPD
jgi:predicted nucleic acid-binding protein